MLQWSKNNRTFFKKRHLFILTMHHMRSKSIALFSLSLLFFCNVFCLNSSALKINNSSLMIPAHLGDISVLHDMNDFHVIKDDKTFLVKKYWMDAEIRNIKKEQLEAFLSKGYLSVNQLEDGAYTIKARVRAPGGGPLLGALFYSLTKVACYGTAAAATGAAVVGTGGAVGAATGVLAASTTLGAGSAVTLTAAAISGAGGTALAAEATVAAVVAGGGIAGAVAAVESASIAAYGLGTLVWFLP